MAPIQPTNRTSVSFSLNSTEQHPHKSTAPQGSSFGSIKSLFTGTGKTPRQATSSLRDGASMPFELAPKVRPGLDAGDGEPPSSFRTEFGPKRVPRRRYPLSPSPEMIRNARQGILSNFLRTGEFLSALDFGDMVVDPQTARLELDETYYFETMHLSGEEEQMDQDQKTMAKLFYVAVNDDELPSYHFWQAEGDVNPMEAPMDFDWGDYFSRNAPNTRFATLENNVLRQRREQNEAGGHAVTGNDNNVVRNAWTPGGQLYRRSNPKRGLRASTVEVIEPAWDKQGTIAGVPYNSSRQGTVDNSRQNGPQPGDEEWETIEAGLEEQLTQKGFRRFMADYKRQSPEAYEALKYGPKSSKVRPVSGDDLDTMLFNDVLKTGVPTVAFKLTQQHFGRPVSPVNEQEPLARGQDPKDWVRDPNNMEDAENTYGGLVMHEEEELEFLDFYNEKAYGKIMIRSRRPIPEKYIHREEPYRARALEDLQNDQPTTPGKLPGLEKGVQNAFALFEDAFGEGASGEGSEAAEKPGAPTSKPTSGGSGKGAQKHTQGRGSSKTPLRPHGNESGATKKDNDPKNQVSGANYGTEATSHGLILVRPSRPQVPNFERLQPPATANEVQPFFEAAARLYPDVNLEKIGVRVMTQDEFKNGDITPAIIQDLAIKSLRWHHLVTSILSNTQAVYVVPAYEDIAIWDATGGAVIENAIQWKIGGERSPSRIKTAFESLCKGLLGTDRLEGPSAQGMDIQVTRYNQEYLVWTQRTSAVEFVQDIFYKIDHPDINIRPTGWKPTLSFDDTKKLRKERLAEQQKKSREGAGNGPEEPAGPLEGLESDAENLREHNKHMEQVIRDLRAKSEARREPETVYGGLDDDIALPRWGPSREHQIRGGSDFPSLITRVPTVSEIEQDQRYQNLIENELLQRETFCRVCRQTFRHGDTTEINNHYRQHRHAEIWLCPFCSRNLSEYTTEARTEHIATAHPTAVPQQAQEDCPWPDCSKFLAQADRFPNLETIMQHLRTHFNDESEEIRSQICPVALCHACMAFMSDIEREEHQAWHNVSQGVAGNPGDGDPDDGDPNSGGAHGGGSHTGGSHGGGANDGGANDGGSHGRGSNNGGSNNGGSHGRGPDNRASNTGASNNGGTHGGISSGENSPVPGSVHHPEELEDPQSGEEVPQPPESKAESAKPGDSRSENEWQQGSESEEDDPLPPNRPTKTTGAKAGKPTVQCCAVCSTQLRSLTRTKLDRHFQRCGNVARTTIDLNPTEAKRRKAEYDKRQKERPKGGTAGHQNRKVRWDADVYDKLSAPAAGHERKRKRMALVELPQQSHKRSRR